MYMVSQNVWGVTPLAIACEHGHTETARVLLKHGAYVDYQNKVFELFYAFTSNCLLKDVALQYGHSALHSASFDGRTECVKVLLKYGAQVDLPVRCDVM